MLGPRDPSRADQGEHLVCSTAGVAKLAPLVRPSVTQLTTSPCSAYWIVALAAVILVVPSLGWLLLLTNRGRLSETAH